MTHVNSAYTNIANSGDRWVVFDIEGEPIRHIYFAHAGEQYGHALSKRSTMRYLSDSEMDALVKRLNLPPLDLWPHEP